MGCLDFWELEFWHTGQGILGGLNHGFSIGKAQTGEEQWLGTQFGHMASDLSPPSLHRLPASPKRREAGERGADGSNVGGSKVRQKEKNECGSENCELRIWEVYRNSRF